MREDELGLGDDAVLPPLGTGATRSLCFLCA
jgi:hypothetical protein